MTRDFLEILALALLICQQATWAGADSRHGNNLPANNLRESVQIDLSSDEPQQPLQQQQQQIQYDLSSNAEVQGPQDNLKKYLLRDLDLNGYTLKQTPRERWRMFQLRELLDTLSSAIPTPSPIQQQQPPSLSSSTLMLSQIPSTLPEPPLSQLANHFTPIYRSGRNKPSTTSGLGGLITGDALLSARSTPAYYRMASSSSLGQQMTGDKNIKARKESVLGLDWGLGNRPSLGSAMITVRRSEGQGDRAQAMRHPMGSEEIAAFTPMHSRSTSDYEWKRVENLSKWNNLRGMWGKRSNLSPLIEYNHNQLGPLSSNPTQSSLENQQVM